jgi:hypothetical protein
MLLGNFRVGSGVFSVVITPQTGSDVTSGTEAAAADSPAPAQTG